MHHCSLLLLFAVLSLCACVHCARMCEATKALNVWMRDVPGLHCWIPCSADGMLPPAATGTVSKTENLQPVSWSCDSSPLLETGFPREDHWLLPSQRPHGTASSSPQTSLTLFWKHAWPFWIFALPLLTCLFIYRGTVRECLERIFASSFCFNILSVISYHLLLSALWKPVRISGLMTALSGSCQIFLSCVLCLWFIAKQENNLTLAGYWMCNTLKCSWWIHAKWRYYPKIQTSACWFAALASAKSTKEAKSEN